MATVRQQFAVRGSEGLFVYDDVSKTPQKVAFQPRTNAIGHRLMMFSPCGKFLAYCDGEKTVVLNTNDWRPCLTLSDMSSTTCMYFSPRSSFFCAWHPFKGAVTKPKPAATVSNNGEVNAEDSNASASAPAPAPVASAVGKPNLKIYSLETMQMVAEFTEKNQKHWNPVWTEDEAIFGRLVGSELLFHQRNDFSKYATKLVAPKLSNFSVSPCSSPYHVAAYVPAGNQPATVRVYRYPEFQSAVANKTFFKADSVSMNWNKKGNALIVMALTEVDSTGKSYYGETNLYLVLTNGDSFLLPMAKPGPVYHVDWHPNSSEFCVVYGYMPAKATLYNLKGEPLFDFGSGPRNEVHYNPRGDIICICGFGNLRGNVEFWSPTSTSGQKQKRDLIRVAHFNAEDTTLFRWAPDGRHFASATTAPRLRVNNGYKLWNSSGQVLFEHKTPAEQEMWEVAWRPIPVSAFPEPATESGNQQQNAVGGGATGGTQTKAQPAAYVPPHLRGVASANRPAFKLHDDDEPASNAKDQQQNQDSNLSKQALKNRKKREAAKNRPLQSGEASAAAGGSSKALEIVNADAETQKKTKNILKKLEQINVLKQKLAAGESLESNQIEKIQKEEELLKELEELGLD